MREALIFIFLSLTFWTPILAQDIYYTKDAMLILNGELAQKPIKSHTKKLNIKLDYETTFITIRFFLNSLETGIDSIDNKLKKNSTEIVFEGLLNLKFINTRDHPPIKFTTDGTLSINEDKSPLRGTGELYHIENAQVYACRLGLTLPINLGELNIKTPFYGLNDNLEAVITQALLQKDKN